MAIRIKETEFPGVLDIESPLFHDERGFFTELHNHPRWREAGFEQSFLQDNLSLSARGTLRGMHCQTPPHAMGKLVRVLRGAAFDAAVDLRRGSPTFGRWIGRTLTADGAALWIPVGFAHGFLALEDDTMLFYKCTNIYAPAAERSLHYADPAVGIQWPMAPLLVSPKDAAAPLLHEIDFHFEYPADVSL